MSTSKASLDTKTALGAFAVTMVVFGSSATTPAMASLMAAFSDQPEWIVTLINTLPSLTTLVGCLLFGAIANTKISFKKIAIIGMLIYGIFGCLPALVGASVGLYGILIIRALTGFGIGLIMPMGAAWFMRMVRDSKARGKYLSWNQAFGSGGAVVMTLLGGWFCAIDWKYTFLAYLFVFVGFIFVLVLFKNPKTIEEIIEEEGAAAAEDFKSAQRVKLGGSAWAIILFYFAFQLFMSPGLMNLSVLMGADQAGVAGTLLTVFVLATAIACVFGAQYLKAFGKFTTGLFFIITAAGLGCIAFGNSVVVFAIGMLLVGVGCTVNFLVNFEISLVTTAAGAAWGASLLMFATNFGNFCSSFFYGILTGITADPSMQVAICTVLMAIAGVLFAVMNCANKKAWGKEAIEARESVSKSEE